MTPQINKSLAWPSRLSVPAKIALGFSTVLALHLSVVALGHYGLHRAENARARQESLRQQVDIFYSIDRTVAELERNVLLFSFTGYQGPEQRVAGLQDRLEEMLNTIELVERGQEILEADHEAFEGMRGHVRRHREIFEAMVTDREKRRNLVEKVMRGHAAGFATAFGQMSEHHRTNPAVLKAANAFTRAQLDSLTFVNRPDSALVRSAKAQLGEADGLLAEAESETGLDLDPMRGAIQAYEQATLQMVQSTRGYLHLVNVVLAGETEELLHMAGVARTACVEQSSILSRKIERDAANYRFLNNLVSVLTIVLGVAASWLIGRDIAPPLVDIATTFDLLARGEECDSIPEVGRNDELGRLANAAEVFRAKAAETTRLLAEEKRVKELERQVAHSQKMESIGQLASGIAHEINTPMQVVANNTRYLDDASQAVFTMLRRLHALCLSADAGGDKWRQDVLSVIEQGRITSAVEQMPEAIHDTAAAAQRVVDIVRAMRTMSHPGKALKEETDINQIVRDAATLSRNRWKDEAVIEYDLAPDLPNPIANPAAISQLVLNLIVNAADAVAEVASENGFGIITLRTSHDESGVAIEVEDTGPGISDALRERIFEPFFTTKDVGKGTGQGLALCYDVVVRQHGGAIDVGGVEGGGALFTIRLPMRPSVPSTESSTDDGERTREVFA